MSTRVVNIRHEPWSRDPDSYVYCGRTGKGRAGPLGNPFSVSQHGIAALSKFRAWFLDRVERYPEYRALVLAALEDPRPLGCFCVDPETGEGACHAKILAEYAEVRP